MSLLKNSVIYKLVIFIVSVFFSILATASPLSDAEILAFASATIPAEGSTIFNPVKPVTYPKTDADIAQDRADIARAEADIAQAQANTANEDEIHLAQDQASLAQELATSMKFKNISNPLEVLAEQGDAKAQYLVGAKYFGGFGSVKDSKKAFEWWQKSASQGNIDAQSDLGGMYFHGDGTTKNYKRGIEWWEKAANQGNVKAQHNLGVTYHKGYGTYGAGKD